MKTKLAKTCVAAFACVLMSSAPSLNANPELQTFDPKIPPTKAEWQHFHKMSDSEVLKFWTFQKDRGTKGLRDWSWQWRMGWVKRCSAGLKESFCKGITDCP